MSNSFQARTSELQLLAFKLNTKDGYFHLSGNPISDQELTFIFQKVKTKISKIEILGLNNCGLTGFGIKIFLDYPLQNLKELYLSKNKLSFQGVKLLTKVNSPKLKVLQICNCDLTDERLRHLTKGYWIELIYFWARDNHFKMSGIQMMQHLTSKNLKSLMLGDAYEESYANYLPITSIQGSNFTQISLKTNMLKEQRQIKEDLVDILMRRFFSEGCIFTLEFCNY